MNPLKLLSYNGRTSLYLSLLKRKRFLALVRSRLKKRGIFISKNAQFGSNLTFGHPLSIVIGDGVKIGDGVLIYQNVTIGKKNNQYPTIGNNVIIFPNVVIVGGISIGDNCVIGAGSVVLHDLPSNSVAAGNPARVIKKT